MVKIADRFCIHRSRYADGTSSGTVTKLSVGAAVPAPPARSVQVVDVAADGTTSPAGEVTYGGESPVTFDECSESLAYGIDRHYGWPVSNPETTAWAYLTLNGARSGDTVTSLVVRRRKVLRDLLDQAIVRVRTLSDDRVFDEITSDDLDCTLVYSGVRRDVLALVRALRKTLKAHTIPTPAVLVPRAPVRSWIRRRVASTLLFLIRTGWGHSQARSPARNILTALYRRLA